MDLFDKIIGQPRAIRLLRKIISSDKFPPSLLFRGEGGTGRALTAVAFARVAACENATGMDECPACLANRHEESFDRLDVSEILELSGNKSDHFRERLSHQRLAHQFKRKCVIVTDADRLNDTMQASLLKAIEEPADRVSWILITSGTERLAGTIRSRNLPVSFRPLSDEEVIGILESKGIQLSGESRELIALSGGSVSLAEFLIERFTSIKEIDEEVKGILTSGKQNRQELLERLTYLVPLAARARPSRRTNLLKFDDAVSRNAYIPLASAVYLSERRTS